MKEMIATILRELLINSIRGYFLYKEAQKLFGMTEDEIEVEYQKEKLKFEANDARALLAKMEGGN